MGGEAQATRRFARFDSLITITRFCRRPPSQLRGEVSLARDSIYTRYDFRGLPIWVASPEAIALPATLAGSVDRVVASPAVMRGDRGAPVLQEACTHFVQSGGGNTVTPLATRTTYPTATTADVQTTTGPTVGAKAARPAPSQSQTCSCSRGRSRTRLAR